MTALTDDDKKIMIEALMAWRAQTTGRRNIKASFPT